MKIVFRVNATLPWSQNYQQNRNIEFTIFSHCAHRAPSLGKDFPFKDLKSIRNLDAGIKSLFLFEPKLSCWKGCPMLRFIQCFSQKALKWLFLLKLLLVFAKICS
jgi:hypothetical protein